METGDSTNWSPGTAPAALSRFKVTPVCVWSGPGLWPHRESSRHLTVQSYSGHFTLDYKERVSHYYIFTIENPDDSLTLLAGGLPCSRYPKLATGVKVAHWVSNNYLDT